MSTLAVHAEPSSAESRLRGVVWGVALAVYLGAAVEMILAEHWAEWQQWIALVAVGVALAATAGAWRSPSPATLRTVRVVSGAVLAVGAIGVGFHLWGNFEFSREVSPGDGVWERIWGTISGGNPALAPGMLAVAAVLALAATTRHPALGEGGGASAPVN